MNVLHIVKKELYAIRDIRTFVLMIAFPLVIILILGSALTSVFNPTAEVKPIRVLYSLDEVGGPLAAAWNGFIEEASRSGVTFESMSEVTDGKQEVQRNRYDGYVEFGDDGVKLYSNDSSSIESNIVEGWVSAFTDQYRLAAVLTEGGLAMQVSSGGSHYILEKSLTGDLKPRAIDFYAVTMLSLIVMTIGMTAIHLIDGERIRKTSIRLMAAPVAKWELLTGKIAGASIWNGLCIAIVMAFSWLAFQVNWGGERSWLVFLVFISEMIFAIGLGLALSSLMRGNLAQAITMILVQVSALLGNAYYPWEPGSVMATVAKFTPYWWPTEGILRLVYSDQASLAYQAIGIMIGLAAVFIAIAGFISKRREGL